LVNRGLVQEGLDDLASAHHPDVPASLRAEAFGKDNDRLGDEVDARGRGSRRRPPREHIVHGICTEARTHLQTPVEGLAAEDLGIGGALEFRKTVEALWSWPFRQPIEIAIGSSHVAVRARRNIDDDLSLWHDYPLAVSSSAGNNRVPSVKRRLLPSRLIPSSERADCNEIVMFTRAERVQSGQNATNCFACKLTERGNRVGNFHNGANPCWVLIIRR